MVAPVGSDGGGEGGKQRSRGADEHAEEGGQEADEHEPAALRAEPGDPRDPGQHQNADAEYRLQDAFWQADEDPPAHRRPNYRA